MAVKEHTHRYVRAVGRLTKANMKSGFVGYYKCADPVCNHLMKAELILGKKSVCNKCGNEFILSGTLRHLTNRPHCKDCTRKRTGKRGKFIDQTSTMDDYLNMAEDMEDD